MTFLIVVLVALFVVQDVSAISCYNYQIPAGQNPADTSQAGTSKKNCAQDFQSQAIFTSGACIKSSFKDATGAEVIAGTCIPSCPPAMNGKQCIYPDGGGPITSLIARTLGVPNAQYLCCCESDYCNSAGKNGLKWTMLISIFAMQMFALIIRH